MTRRIAALATAAWFAAACSGRPPATSTDPRSAELRPHVAVLSGVSAPALPSVDLVALGTDRFLLVYDEPGGGSALRFDTTNPWKQRVPMPVTAARRDAAGVVWFRVALPIGAGDESGWVRAADVRAIERSARVVVDLSRRTLLYERDGKAVRRFRVAIGAPTTPTPTGTFYVWAQVPQPSPSGPYGVFALGLSVFSPDIPDERIAIHGTADPADPGLAISNGCIRVYNPEMLKLRRVPLGTPVIVRR